MNISKPLPEKWFFQPQGLLVGSGCTEIQQFRKPAPSPLALILWSYVVIYCSQCVHFLNFLSAVRDWTNWKAINLSVKFSVLESFSEQWEQCSRLLLKYSFQISHKVWLFVFLQFKKRHCQSGKSLVLPSLSIKIVSVFETHLLKQSHFFWFELN